MIGIASHRALEAFGTPGVGTASPSEPARVAGVIDGLGEVGGVDLAIARQVGRLGRSLPSLKWHRRTSPTLHARGRTSDGDLNASGTDVEGRASLVGLAFQQRLTAGLVNQIPDRVAVGVGSVFNRVVVPGGNRRIDHRD